MRREHGNERRSLIPMLFQFVGIFVAVLVVLAVIWPVLAPAYTRMIGWAARAGFRLVEPTQVSVLEVRGAQLWVHRVVGPGQIQPFTWFDRYTFFAVVPLIALFAAAPGLGWTRRGTRLAMGLVLMFLAQTSYVVVSVQLAYAAIGLTSVGPIAARMLNGWQVVVRVLWEAMPLMVWGALTASAWRKTLGEIRKQSQKRREAQPLGFKDVGYEARKGWES